MYNLKEIKSIPISEVAEHYGIKLTQKHNRLWGKLRDEKHESFSINLKNNLWYDFGSGKGGSVIDFVAEVEGITPKEAINVLAEMYNIKKNIIKGWTPLTDQQYREIGIIPELATLNFNYDLNVHSIEQLARWSEKYGMPVKELAEKLPDDYNKLIIKVAGEYISQFITAYNTKINEVIRSYDDPEKREFYTKWALQDEKEINYKACLFKRALKGDNSLADKYMVNVERDIQERRSTLLHEKQKYVITTYKEQFKFPAAEYITLDGATALLAAGYAVKGIQNALLSMQELKSRYSDCGNKIQQLDKKLKDMKLDTEEKRIILNELISVKETFKSINKAIESLKDASRMLEVKMSANVEKNRLCKDVELVR